MTISDVRKFKYPSSINFTVSEIYHKASHTLPDLVDMFEIATLGDLNDTGINRFFLTFGENDTSYVKGNIFYKSLIDHKEFWLTKNHSLFGHCYSFVMPKWILDLKVQCYQSIIIRYICKIDLNINSYQVTVITVLTNMAASVFLHHEGQYFQGNVRSKIQVKERNYTFVDIEHAVSILKCNHFNHEFLDFVSIQLQYDLPVHGKQIHGKGCSNRNNFNFENCTIDVMFDNCTIF